MISSGTEKLKKVFNKLVSKNLLSELSITIKLIDFNHKRCLKEMKLFFDFWGYFTDEKLMEAEKMNKLYQKIVVHDKQRQKMF